VVLTKTTVCVLRLAFLKTGARVNGCSLAKLKSAASQKKSSLSPERSGLLLLVALKMANSLCHEKCRSNVA
jgi:hypothetical protein